MYPARTGAKTRALYWVGIPKDPGLFVVNHQYRQTLGFDACPNPVAKDARGTTRGGFLAGPS
jgi:hypothetical protein